MSWPDFLGDVAMSTAVDAAPDAPQPAKIFISYSRRASTRASIFSIWMGNFEAQMRQ
jgi:hypothetical protein